MILPAPLKDDRVRSAIHRKQNNLDSSFGLSEDNVDNQNAASVGNEANIKINEQIKNAGISDDEAFIKNVI